MGKNIVYPYVTFTQFIDEPILKRLALFFEHIYIGEGRFSIISSIKSSNINDQSLLYEKAVWDFLIENNIVKTYPFLPDIFDNPDKSAEVTELIQQFSSLMPQLQNKEENTNKLNNENSEDTKQQAFHKFFLSHDISVRLDTIQ